MACELVILLLFYCGALCVRGVVIEKLAINEFVFRCFDVERHEYRAFFSSFPNFLSLFDNSYSDVMFTTFSSESSNRMCPFLASTPFMGP